MIFHWDPAFPIAFVLVFTGKINFQGPTVPCDLWESLKQGRFTLVKENYVGEHLNKLDKRKSSNLVGYTHECCGGGLMSLQGHS